VLPDFRLETYFSRWEFRAEFNLAASDVETMSLEDLLALADPADRDAWQHLRLGYTETFGAPALRKAIADTYANVGMDDVVCFAGAQEGIYCAMQALLGPDDHAVVLVPNYQSLGEVPLAICAVTGVALRSDAGWTLDLAELESALRPNTTLIAINFPSNPTGTVIDRETFDGVVRLAADRGLYLFSDEVYRGLERDAQRTLPHAADCYARAVSLGVMSKAYGLPGLRIGWIACRDAGVLTRMERMKHYTSICNSAPSEVLATIALKARSEIVGRNRTLVRQNLEHVRAFMQSHRDLFEWDDPDGGCVAFPRYLGPEGVDEFCRSAVEDSGVLLLPNSIYQSRLAPVPNDRFRIGYGRKNVPAALERLDAHITRR